MTGPKRYCTYIERDTIFSYVIQVSNLLPTIADFALDARGNGDNYILEGRDIETQEWGEFDRDLKDFFKCHFIQEAVSVLHIPILNC